MKKLLKFMACALAVSFGLTACDNGEDPHNPYDSGYNPQGSQLNTSHELVGQMYGEEGVVDDPKEAQGIVFAVSKDGKTAYLVSFTDAMVVGGNTPKDAEKYCFHTSVGYCALQSIWGLTIPTSVDSVKRQVEVNGQMVDSTIVERSAAIHNVDGEINTNLIIKAFQDAVKQDSNKSMPKVYAAQLCRDYYRREWSKKLNDGSGSNADQLALKWKHTQGQWYLPSIEELGDLMKNKDVINKKYGNAEYEYIQDNDYFFMRIGGAEDHAYWSSSEFNIQSAWYCLPNEIKGKKKDGYPGNRRYGYFQKSDRINMYVRPIRKAPIK